MRLDGLVADSRRSRTIPTEAQPIWDVLADFGAISSWADIVDHSCLLTPAADGVGVGATRRIQLGRNVVVERITDFDPPHTLAYDIEGLPAQVHRLNNRWTLQPVSGGTEVTLTTTVEIGPNRLQHLAENAVARFSAKQLDALLEALSRRMERAHV